MNKIKKNLVAYTMTLIISAIGITALVNDLSVYAMKTSEVSKEVESGNVNSYEAYSRKYKNKSVDVTGFSVNVSEENALYDANNAFTIEESGRPGLYIDEYGHVELKFTIQKEGLYAIGIEYYPTEGRGQDIKVSFMIDGNLPFNECEQIVLSRVWKDETEIQQDSKGNDLYPDQIQAPEWITYYFSDSNGYYNEPFLFYFTSGEHILKFTSLEEAVIISNILFAPEKQLLTYEDVVKEWHSKGYTEITNYFYKHQAESMAKKSSPMLSAVADRSEPSVDPYDGLKIKLNTLGGGRYDTNGMWVEYDIEVPSDGLYQLVFKAKQSNMKEQSAYRNIYINGEIPFEEGRNFAFEYSSDYENIIFGNENGAYLIKLNEGKNTIRLEATLGDIAGFCNELDESLDILNKAYRKIVRITGTKPDVNRDYSLDTKMPDVIEIFEQQQSILSDISKRIKEKYGKSTSYTAAIDALSVQLERMYKNHYDIPSNITSFNTNLSTLGSKVEEMKRTDLTLDYVMITGTDNKLPKPTSGFWKKCLFAVRNFIDSFFSDYSVIGSTEEYGETIEVWMIGGREQAEILKQIINSEFSNEAGIGVNVKLISDTKTLQQATMAGEGPDVAIGVPQSDAMNFAFRGATLDLTSFKDFEDCTRRFANSAIDVLSYEGKVMGLPQTMDYPVLFYREDILAELGVDVPKTWEDVYALMPVLAQNNMTFGLPMGSASEGTRDSISSFGALLYQRGGMFYTEDLLSTTFSDEITIETMADWSDLYTSYGLPISYSFVNRFSAGDMPIAVQNYSTYNTLILYAPQLSNVWKWTNIPGTVKEDGSIDHSVPITVTASIILAETDNENASWEFIKWWTSEGTQADFGRSIENLMGKAGRYGTANIEAMESIPWSGEMYKSLQEQLNWTVAVPEIPGGYYMGRYLDNTFREIYSSSSEGGSEIRRIMYQYDLIVDNEITYQKEALSKVQKSQEEEK